MSGCCAINLSWYSVLSRVISYTFKDWRVFIAAEEYLLRLFENIVGTTVLYRRSLTKIVP